MWTSEGKTNEPAFVRIHENLVEKKAWESVEKKWGQLGRDKADWQPGQPGFDWCKGSEAG